MTNGKLQMKNEKWAIPRVRPSPRVTLPVKEDESPKSTGRWLLSAFTREVPSCMTVSIIRRDYTT